jgi:uncharacterized protein
LKALLLGLFLAASQGFQVPPNDGWVTDLAGMLSPAEEQALEARLDAYRVGTGHDVALLTVPSLAGRPIEEAALAVARKWKLGGEEKNDGALLFVARDEREVRIEVGRGLEGDLTDAVAGRIIRDVIVPEFRAGRFAQGLERGIDAMLAAIGGDLGPIERSSGGLDAQMGGISCFVSILMLVILLKILGRQRYRGGGGLGSALPWLILSTMSRGRAHGFGGGGGFRGFGGAGGFRGFGGGGGFSGGGASGRW